MSPRWRPRGTGVAEGPADAGYTEHLSGKLLAIESETFSGNGVPCSVSLVLRRGCRPTVNLDMEAIAVEALVSPKLPLVIRAGGRLPGLL